ncbi:MAG: TetR/AcrR family transcriptional regulator [Acidimicrobiales bacterium]
MPTSTSARNPTRWVGLPALERQAERRTLLLDAALDLLGTEGWAGTTVRAVCQAARLNPRYFYESFDDLDALVVAVYDRLVAQLGAEVFTAMAEAGEGTGAQVRAALDTILQFVEDDPRRGRVLYVEALGSESLNRRRIETAHALVGVVEQGGAERHGAPPPGEPIGRITAAILVGGAGELVVAWLDGRIDATRAQLVDDATALFIALGDAAATIASNRRRT